MKVRFKVLLLSALVLGRCLCIAVPAEVESSSATLDAVHADDDVDDYIDYHVNGELEKGGGQQTAGAGDALRDGPPVLNPG